MASADSTEPSETRSGRVTRRHVLQGATVALPFGYSLAAVPRVGGVRSSVHGSATNRGRGNAQSTSSRWANTTKLTAADANADDFFGHGVSLDGDRALVWAPRLSKVGSDDLDRSSAAYAFEFGESRWRQTQRLTVDDPFANGALGPAPVSISGTRALLGGPGDSEQADQAGAAYVFELEGDRWRQAHKLTAADPSADDYFGWPVSLDGERALIGSNSDRGSAHVFDFDGSGDGWRQIQKITPDNAVVETPEAIVRALSLDGSRALIGHPNDFENTAHAGAVYVFEFDGSRWDQKQKLTPTDARREQYFGFAISLDGERALVGAPGDDEQAERGGAVYVFDLKGEEWIQAQKFTAPDSSAREFGRPVSLDGDRALVGSNGSEGAAYVFEFDRSAAQWRPGQRLTASDTDVGDDFGSAISLDGKHALVGAPGDDERAEQAGAAYVFTESTEPTAEPSNPPAGNDDDSASLPQLGGLGLVGFTVGFLIGNAEDKEIKKKSLGVLAVVFGSGGLFGLLQRSETVGWLVIAGVLGVLLGVIVGSVLRRNEFTFAP
jgi:hypothetical protein